MSHDFLVYPLRWVGWFIVTIMVIWIGTTNTATNHVMTRVIAGLLMVTLSYIIEIRNKLLK